MRKRAIEKILDVLLEEDKEAIKEWFGKNCTKLGFRLW